MWAGFIAFVLVMLALDLFVLGGRKAHRVSVKEAASWVVAWVGLAVAFGALLWWYLDGTAGREVANGKALEFLTGAQPWRSPTTSAANGPCSRRR